MVTAANTTEPAIAAEQIDAEKFSILSRQIPALGIATLVVSGLSWQISEAWMDHAARSIWCLTIWLQTLLVLWINQRLKRPGGLSVQYKITALHISLTTCAIPWGVYGWLFTSTVNLAQDVLVVLTIAAVVAGCLSAFSFQKRLFIAYSVIAIGPVTFKFSQTVTEPYAEISLLLFVIEITLLTICFSIRKNIHRNIELQAQFASVLETLTQERDRAQKAVADKNRFIATATHDLKQPLLALDLDSRNLMQEKHSPQVNEIVTRINESVQGLRHMFDNLMDNARIESTEISVRRQIFDLRDLAEKLVIQQTPSCVRKGLSIRYSGPSKMVFSDPVLVERILSNMISNAVRFTSSGGILIALRGQGNSVSVCVYDTGVGIAEGHFKRIFQANGQLKNEPNVQDRGLGLGLSIAESLAETLGHQISVHSRLGRGSLFKLTLAQVIKTPDTKPTAQQDEQDQLARQPASNAA